MKKINQKLQYLLLMLFVALAFISSSNVIRLAEDQDSPFPEEEQDSPYPSEEQDSPYPSEEQDSPYPSEDQDSPYPS